MKIIIIFALCALVSAQTQAPSALDDKMLQEVYDCRPGEKCADKIKSTSDKFSDAIKQACPKCTDEQKKNMESFLDAYNNGMSIEEAKKKYNPDNKYFDIVENPAVAFSFNSTVN